MTWIVETVEDYVQITNGQHTIKIGHKRLSYTLNKAKSEAERRNQDPTVTNILHTDIERDKIIKRCAYLMACKAKKQGKQLDEDELYNIGLHCFYNCMKYFNPGPIIFYTYFSKAYFNMVCRTCLPLTYTRKVNYTNNTKITDTTIAKSNYNTLSKNVQPVEINMARLPAKALNIIDMYYMQDKTFEEIAQTYGVTRQAIQQYLKIQVDKLREVNFSHLMDDV
jgi:RNA polymerase sigma factor (sigma-70 family)